MRIALLFPMLLAGCATGSAKTMPEGAACNAETAQALVGRPATRETAQEAIRLSGARDLRWVRPDMMVTMDYRADRLNIELDAAERVTAIRCG